MRHKFNEAYLQKHIIKGNSCLFRSDDSFKATIRLCLKAVDGLQHTLIEPDIDKGIYFSVFDSENQLYYSAYKFQNGDHAVLISNKQNSKMHFLDYMNAANLIPDLFESAAA